MNQINRLKPEFVTEVPRPMHPGVLYVSDPFKLAMHLCCCGCGGEVSTRYGAGGWTLTLDGGEATLYPSIGPSTLRCRSHYWIQKGHVSWLPRMTDAEIAASRARDAAKRQRAFAAAAPWYVRLWRWLLGIIQRR